MITYRMTFQRSVHHHLSEILAAVLRNFGLLFRVAVIFKREHNWVFRRLEGTFGNGFNDFLSTQKRCGPFQSKFRQTAV